MNQCPVVAVKQIYTYAFILHILTFNAIDHIHFKVFMFVLYNTITVPAAHKFYTIRCVFMNELVNFQRVYSKVLFSCLFLLVTVFEFFSQLLNFTFYIVVILLRIISNSLHFTFNTHTHTSADMPNCLTF